MGLLLEQVLLQLAQVPVPVRLVLVLVLLQAQVLVFLLVLAMAKLQKLALECLCASHSGLSQERVQLYGQRQDGLRDPDGLMESDHGGSSHRKPQADVEAGEDLTARPASGCLRTTQLRRAGRRDSQATLKSGAPVALVQVY